MIAAGLALTSKTVRDRAAGAVSPVMDGAGRVIDQTGDRVQEAKSAAQAKLSESQGRAAGAVNDALNSAEDSCPRPQDPSNGGRRDDRRQDRGRDRLHQGFGLRRSEQARQIISDNAALIGGLGIAIGAISRPPFRKRSSKTGPQGRRATA